MKNFIKAYNRLLSQRIIAKSLEVKNKPSLHQWYELQAKISRRDFQKWAFENNYR